MSDEDRPRKSWREIDKARDGSAHRKDERPDASMLTRRSSGRSQKSYRAALDRLFDSGKIADLVEKKDPTEAKPRDTDGESRLKLLKKIRDAVDRDEVTRTADAYLKQYDDLPEDMEVLPRLLEHRDPDIQLQAMRRMDELLDSQRPKRTRAIVGQLKMIRDFADEQEMMELADRLIDRLD